MAQANLKEKIRAKWGGGAFNALPRTFTKSLLSASLSPYACKLLMDMQAQYNGMNNGDLTVTWSLMKPRGWSGRRILDQTRKELISCGLLVLTRQGGRHKASLYALTLYELDEGLNKVEEFSLRHYPMNKWMLEEQRLKSASTLKAPNKLNPCPSTEVNQHMTALTGRAANSKEAFN